MFTVSAKPGPRVTPIGALLPGQRAVIEGEVQLSEVIFRRRRALLVRLSDGTGFLNLRFFYFSRAQAEGLARGTRFRCFGEVRRGPLGLEIVHPEYRRLAAQPERLRKLAGAMGPRPGAAQALADHLALYAAITPTKA
jgi:ATP-dependent DNA helicase RecG